MAEPKAGEASLDEGLKKVAALLLSMEKAQAERILKHFSESEIRRVVETTISLGTVPRARIEGFVTEIVDAFEKGADVSASIEDVEKLMSGVVQPEQLASILSSVKGAAERSVWQQLTQVPEPNLNQFLAKEHPQVVAFILGRMSATASAAVLRRTPAPLRAELVRRVLAMRPISDVARAVVEQCIREELLMNVSKEAGPPVHSRVADIINKMDRQQIEEVLTNLEARRPKDAKLVKGLLFTFDDVARLSAADRVKLFDAVPAEQIILALHGASQSLREFVLASVSARSRRMIEQDLAGAANVMTRDVNKARRAIADAALDLADRGHIDIAQQQDEQ